MKTQITLTFTKVICLVAIIAVTIMTIWLKDSNIAITAIPVIFGAIANQDYQRRKKDVQVRQEIEKAD